MMISDLIKDTMEEKEINIIHNDDCTIYELKNESGSMKITEYEVFPGIFLIHRDVNNFNLKYTTAHSVDFVEIAYCKEGRFEFQQENHVFCLEKGHLSVARYEGKDISLQHLTEQYYGTSVIINPEIVPPNLSLYLNGINIDINQFIKKFIRDKKFYITRCEKRIKRFFSDLYYAPDVNKIGYFKIKILELFVLLTSMEVERNEERKEREEEICYCSNEQHCCSKEQIEVTKHVCKYIRKHINKRFTIEELAKKFHMSPTQLKHCFYCVYGKPVYTFIRTYKMQLAAKYLKETDYSIIDIAALFGYENSSKFAKAFKDVMEISPSEYRRESREQNVFLES